MQTGMPCRNRPSFAYKEHGKVVKESFDYESGLDIDCLPLLAAYKRDDPDDFIL